MQRLPSPFSVFSVESRPPSNAKRLFLLSESAYPFEILELFPESTRPSFSSAFPPFLCAFPRGREGSLPSPRDEDLLSSYLPKKKFRDSLSDPAREVLTWFFCQESKRSLFLPLSELEAIRTSTVPEIFGNFFSFFFFLSLDDQGNSFLCVFILLPPLRSLGSPPRGRQRRRCRLFRRTSRTSSSEMTPLSFPVAISDSFFFFEAVSANSPSLPFACVENRQVSSFSAVRPFPFCYRGRREVRALFLPGMQSHP